MLLEGKRLIVTGGLTGIGKATVLGAVREGGSVVSMSLEQPGDPLAASMLDAAAEAGPGQARYLRCDVRVKDEVDSAVTEAIRLMRGLDALVNCAGSENVGPTEDLTGEVMLEQFRVHVLGTAFTNTAAFRHYRTVGGGALINYSSYAGAEGMPSLAAYSAAKGGVLAYTRTIAKEWGQYNIRANVIMPAAVTELLEATVNDMDPQRRAEWEAWSASKIPLGGKLGRAEDAANLNLFLASDMATYIHGQTIGVDGGMFMNR